MDIVAKQNLTFSQIKAGSVYRTINGGCLYLKLKNPTVKSNTVSLKSGCLFKHNDSYDVILVSGCFV